MDYLCQCRGNRNPWAGIADSHIPPNRICQRPQMSEHRSSTICGRRAVWSPRSPLWWWPRFILSSSVLVDEFHQLIIFFQPKRRKKKRRKSSPILKTKTWALDCLTRLETGLISSQKVFHFFTEILLARFVDIKPPENVCSLTWAFPNYGSLYQWSSSAGCRRTRCGLPFNAIVVVQHIF